MVFIIIIMEVIRNLAGAEVIQAHSISYVATLNPQNHLLTLRVYMV